MGVDHRRTNVFMAEEFLNRANVIAIFQQVCRKRMTQSMAPRVLGELRLATGFFDYLLQNAFMEMVPATFSGAGISGKLCGGERELPPPLTRRVGVFPF